MTEKFIQLCLVVALACWLLKPAWLLAKEEKQSAGINELQQTIESQQKQLDAQQKTLQQLRQQLQPLLTGAEKNQTRHAVSLTDRRNDFQTQTRDDNQPLDDWQGSFALHGSDTRIKVGGFIELDIIHDNNAINSKGQFIADTIPTRNSTAIDGAYGQTHFSVAPSRLYIETRTAVNAQRLKSYLSIDMFADELGVEAKPRLRQAYVELSNSLWGGDLLIGQAWSTVTDLESAPDVLDFRGSDALFGQIQPQLRWSKPLQKNVKLMLAAETASNHIIENANSLTRLPDGIIAITWDSNMFNLMGSLLVKDLSASVNSGPVQSAVGVGGNISGKLRLPFGLNPDEFMFSLTYGKGIGSHFQNANPDAVYDVSSASLETIKLFAVTLAYRHNWNTITSSTFTYCCVEIYNHDAQTADALQGTEYSSGNLVWNINSHWLIGVEGIWGKRDNKDDAEGTVIRTLFVSRVSF